MGCPWWPPHELAMEDIQGMHPSKNPSAIPWDAHGDLHMRLPWKISKACTHPRIPVQFHGMPMATSTCACHGRYPRHAPIQESQCNSMGCPWRPPHALAMEDIQGMHPSKNPSAIPWDAHGDLHMSLPWKIAKACT